MNDESLPDQDTVKEETTNEDDLNPEDLTEDQITADLVTPDKPTQADILFYSYDLDGDNLISKQEYKFSYEIINKIELSDSEVDLDFKLRDTDFDDKFSRSEFEAFHSP